MKTMKLWRIAFMMLAAFSLASCGSDEPRYADPEAHEKTVQLNEKYAPLMVATWHYEKIGERHRYFERLTFKDDGTFTGFRKWQCRELVTIDGKEQYTDWQNAGQPTGWGDEEGPMNGTFTGTWQLRYWNPEGEGSTKRNCLQLEAKYDEERKYMAYSYVATFDYADETTLRFQGYYAKDEDGWVNFQRGDAEASF